MARTTKGETQAHALHSALRVGDEPNDLTSEVYGGVPYDTQCFCSVLSDFIFGPVLRHGIMYIVYHEIGRLIITQSEYPTEVCTASCTAYIPHRWEPTQLIIIQI